MRLRIVQYTHGTSKSWDTTDNCIMCSKAVSRFLIGAHVVRILSPCSARYELSVFVCMDNNLHRALYWNQDTATNPYPRQWLFPGHYFKSLVQCWFNINIIDIIENCQFQYQNIMAKSKSQYYCGLATLNVTYSLLNFTWLFHKKWLLHPISKH